MSMLERGVFTLSLDFELIWGTQDLFGPEEFREACQTERDEIVARLLDMLGRYQIRATWCVVGHLFLDGCPTGNEKHPEIVRPCHSWVRGDWFEHDPGGTEATAPTFFGRSLVEMIRDCPTPQEIACHSFSHVIFGDRGCSRETAASEIDACLKVASQMGIELRSFAFPRNRVGHLDVLREKGFIAFRGPGGHWYERQEEAGLWGRLAHLLDVVAARTPRTVLPVATAGGLWNIPGSMIYFPMHGVRRFIPMSRRIARGLKGLAQAIDQRRIFHLWFHPTNLSDKTDQMFDGLGKILSAAAAARDRKELDILTMVQIARAANDLSEIETCVTVGSRDGRP